MVCLHLGTDILLNLHSQKQSGFEKSSVEVGFSCSGRERGQLFDGHTASRYKGPHLKEEGGQPRLLGEKGDWGIVRPFGVAGWQGEKSSNP